MDRRVSRPFRKDGTALASRTYRSRNGNEGADLVGGFAGRPALRRYRRYDSHFADAKTGRRPARRSLRRVRITAGAGVAVVRAKRGGGPRLRSSDQTKRAG